MVAQVCNPSSWETEMDRFLGLTGWLVQPTQAWPRPVRKPVSFVNFRTQRKPVSKYKVNGALRGTTPKAVLWLPHSCAHMYRYTQTYMHIYLTTHSVGNLMLFKHSHRTLQPSVAMLQNTHITLKRKAQRKSSTQASVSKTILQEKTVGCFGKMADSRTETGNTQNETGVSCSNNK